jgi:hypothetical protein
VIKPIVLIVLFYRRLRYGYAFRRIPLTQGKFAIVDPDDYHRLSKYKWQTDSERRRTSYARRMANLDGKRKCVLMHREIIPVPDNMVVDHINHNGLDNRKANLRPATVAQNACNRRHTKDAKKFKGLVWDKRRNKWHVRFGCNGKKIHVGYFDDQITAAHAYDQAAKKHHGQFAALNFDD